MTKVAGLNLGRTESGQPLLDGGCVVVEDGDIAVGVSEERLNRQKYSPGYGAALEYCLEYLDAGPEEIDRYVFSNCLERPQSVNQVQKQLDERGIDIPRERIVVSESHHLSHAASAFFPSQYDEALILVADHAGNTVTGDYGRYEFNGLERTSVYAGNGTDIELVGRHHDTCSVLGLGTAYRYVTMYLGFRTYKDAGKVMGLASYGDGELSDYRLFDDDWNCLIENNPHNRSAAVRQCLQRQGFDPGERKSDPSSPSKLQKEIAWLLQREVERVLVELVDHYAARTGHETLCFAGGVALNCVANERIRRETRIERIYVPPAPGDYGQPLGNALYGTYLVGNNERRVELSNAYFGRTYPDAAIKETLEATDGVTYRVADDVQEFVASALANGDLVGHFHGRSEFGPRALGNRSIIADPRDEETKTYVNRNVKFRENFRPFAPTILREYYDEYFDAEWNPPCQFMILAQRVRPSKVDEIPAVVHVNGSSRVQTITREQNARYYDIIDEFYRRTGVPVVLNTSFNLAGEPIVETPQDAVSTFLRSGLDYLVLGDYVVRETQ